MNEQTEKKWKDLQAPNLLWIEAGSETGGNMLLVLILTPFPPKIEKPLTIVGRSRRCIKAIIASR